VALLPAPSVMVLPPRTRGMPRISYLNWLNRLASSLIERGYRITTGGTDNHLMLVDLRPKNAELTGADAEKWLEAAGLICNKNGIPNDPRPPKFTSGIRLGSPATTTPARC
jgi:glycine hydroxymethyltransferase